MTLDYEQKLKDLDTFYHEKIELLNRNIEKQIIRELNKKVKSGVTASGIEKKYLLVYSWNWDSLFGFCNG